MGDGEAFKGLFFLAASFFTCIGLFFGVYLPDIQRINGYAQVDAYLISPDSTPSSIIRIVDSTPTCGDVGSGVISCFRGIIRPRRVCERTCAACENADSSTLNLSLIHI